MSSHKNLDLDFWESSKDFFHRYQDQVDIIEEMFTEVANAFPQEKLRLIFQNSKGCKFNKGSQLKRLPYQVLDIVRDFDAEKGFNIRFLNWWGVGFFVFITYGSGKKNNVSANWTPFFQNFKLHCSESPFDYTEIVKGQVVVSIENLDAAINSSCQLTLWKRIDLPNDSKEASNIMVKLTEDILSYHIY
jgi:hypothetical protein